MQNDSQESGGTGILMIVLLPVAAAVLVLLGLAYLIASTGAQFKTVRKFCFPAAWIVSSTLSIPFALAVTFCFSMLTADKALFVLYFAHITDFVFFNIWNPQIPLNEILFYQVLVYLVFGRHFLRHFTIVIMDVVTLKIASEKGIRPYLVRKQRKLDDSGYASASLFYDSRRSAPLLGVLCAAAAGYSPEEFYAD